MRRTLKLHPDSHGAAIAGIEVDISRPGANALQLHYVIAGRIDDLRLPPPAAPARSDGLWQHTCLEAFVRPARSEGYCEFNFSPSTQWAAYRFDGYRAGMRNINELSTPQIAAHRTGAEYNVQISLELAAVPELADGAAWRLGIACVIEEMGGHKSYWALEHPVGKPDFHNADCFALEIAGASPA